MSTAFLLASAAFLFSVGLCAIVAFRGDALSRLVGLEAVALVECLFLVVYSEALGRPLFLDLALALALLSFGGALVFARFLERWA